MVGIVEKITDFKYCSEILRTIWIIYNCLENLEPFVFFHYPPVNSTDDNDITFII